MNKTTAITLVSSLVLLLGLAPTRALNITIPDADPLPAAGQPSGPHGIGAEDQEVEHPSVWGQEWDLEAFVLEDTTLTLIGGYDFRYGQSAGGTTYRTGDIFVDVAGVDFGHASGYDYAIHFDRDAQGNLAGSELSGVLTGGYDLVKLLPTAQLDPVVFAVNALSNPWKYQTGGEVVGTGQFTYLADNPLADTLAGYDLGGDLHRTLAVSVDFLSPGQGALFHYTMSCGNDMIRGSKPVPDGGLTVMLLGMALFGMGMVKRPHLVRVRK